MQFMCMLTQFKRTLDKSKQWMREFDRISNPTATAKVIGVRGRARGLELAPAGRRRGCWWSAGRRRRRERAEGEREALGFRGGP